MSVSVSASGNGLTYEWWYAAAGSTKFYRSSITTATYTTRMDETRDGRKLYCVVRDSHGQSVRSTTVSINMDTTLSITRQPVSATARDGELVSVSVSASGNGLTYEWWYAAAGSTKFYRSSITTATYTTRMDETRDGRKLYCVVRDSHGQSVRSSTVTLNMSK